MKIHQATISLCVLAGLAGATQVSEKPDITVRKAYSGGANVIIEGLGVCSITPEKVSCWNMDGANDEILAERVRAYLLGNNGQEPTFRYGKKNRYVIVRAANTYGSFTVPGRSYMNTMQIQYDQGGGSVQMGRIDVGPSEKEISVITSFTETGPASVDLPFAKDKSVTYGPGKVTLGDWQPIKEEKKKPGAGNLGFGRGYPGNGGQGLPGPLWKVILTNDGLKGLSVSFAVLDKAGKPLLHVDKSGKPVSDVEYLKHVAANPQNGYPYIYPGQDDPNSPYRTVVFQGAGQQVGESMIYQTNVDPTYIGSLRITSTRQVKVQVDGFPLDPSN